MFFINGRNEKYSKLKIYFKRFLKDQCVAAMRLQVNLQKKTPLKKRLYALVSINRYL